MTERKFQLTFSSSARDAHELPTDLEFLKLLGKGSFGKVVKCLKKDTNQTVAVKLPMFLEKISTEVCRMEKLMCLKLDQKNIIRFFGWFDTSRGKALVFECLDISLQDFILKTSCAPMLLSDVSTIIHQLATAFDALKNIRLIHTDLKANNIMMVDHQTRPFRVKLIDFGLAMHRSKAKQGTTMQVVYFRAPEIMLGLPFSEAIDMWSLGCVMFIMLHGRDLFTGDTEYEALHDITALLGMPASHLLRHGIKADRYFTRTWYNRWRLKTHQEYWKEKANTQQQYKSSVCFCLNDLMRLRLERKNRSEGVQRAQCINLLKAMLRLDEAKRITPMEILTHPFITSGQYSSHIKKNSLKACFQTAENMLLQDTEEENNEEPPATPPGVILVRPAAAENTLHLEDEERAAKLPAGLNRKDSVTERDTMARTTDIAGTQKKSGKKTNCIRCLFSLVKKTFGSRCTAAINQDDQGHKFTLL